MSHRQVHLSVTLRGADKQLVVCAQYLKVTASRSSGTHLRLQLGRLKPMLQYEILSMVSLYLTFLGVGGGQGQGGTQSFAGYSQDTMRNQDCAHSPIYIWRASSATLAGRDRQYHTTLALERGPQPHCGTQTRHTGDVIRGRRESLRSEKSWSTQKRKKN